MIDPIAALTEERDGARAEPRPFVVSLREIGGEIARWACRQSPYGMPDNLDLVMTQFYGLAAKDFTRFIASPWDRWREFASREQLEWYIGDRLIASGGGFKAWNAPKSGHGAPFVFVARYSGPSPDDDFIDLDAFLRNVACSIYDAAMSEHVHQSPAAGV